MDYDQNHASGDRGKKCYRTVDRSRQHRREDYEQNGIERGPLRERTFMPKPHHDQGGEKHDDAAQRHLTNVKSFGSTPRPNNISKEFQNAFIDDTVQWQTIFGAPGCRRNALFLNALGKCRLTARLNVVGIFRRGRTIACTRNLRVA
jgi:hypothetical protein